MHGLPPPFAATVRAQRSLDSEADSSGPQARTRGGERPRPAALAVPRADLYQIRPARPPRLETLQDYARALRGVTPQATRIAAALDRGEIELNLLSDLEFRQACGARNDGPLPLAYTEGHRVFLNAERGDSWARLLDAVHEGTHALDHLAARDLGLQGDEHGSSGDDPEVLAYRHQIEFARALSLDSAPPPGLDATAAPDQINAAHTLHDVHRHVATAHAGSLEVDLERRAAPVQHQRRLVSPPANPSDPHALLAGALQHARGGTVRAEAILSTGNRVHSVDVEGPAIFARQAELIRSAQQEVLIQTFVWDPNSKAAETLLEALDNLAQREAAGDAPGRRIKVRLLVNEEAGIAQRFMQATGNKKAAQPNSRPPGPLPDALLGERYAHLADRLDLEVRGHRHGSVNSLHSKSVIVDGRHAAVTGANVQSRNDAPQPAYDFGVSLSGPVARSLREDFATNWNRSVNRDQPTRPIDPDDAPLVLAPAAGGVTMAVLTKKPNFNPLNTDTRNPQDQAFLSAIDNARSSIQIMTPNLNAPAVITALRAAAARGVQVELLVSKGFNDKREDNRVAGGTNAAAIEQLQRDGIDTRSLQIRYFRNPAAPDGAPVPDGNVIGSSHAKFMAVDGELAIFGSSNMDKTSWHFSGETNVAVFDRAAAAKVKAAVFDAAWGRSVAVADDEGGRGPKV
ncbi:cardiolipin synthase [Caldimonas brevitalea]|uniref:Cardiolipin synthase n=2 Tax=Caldimonas brevitalea TaxID=413882 RepID=A0A0G3BLH8_9BURK|nr:cardiolipin synthase [Caldimonas brevitalea]